MFEKIKQERLLKEKLGRIGTYEVLSDGKIICKLDENKLKRVGYYNSPNNIYSLRLPTLFEIEIDNNLNILNLTSIEYDMSDMTFDKEIIFMVILALHL